MLRDADELLRPAVAASISALQVTDDRDAAVVKLAERYAAAIDDAESDERTAALRDLGPKLLAALTALQATPAARARQRTSKGGDGAGQGGLAQLRAARR